MKVPKVTSCCCGCTLRTGTKILGWIQLIGGLLSVIYLSVNAEFVKKIIHENTDSDIETILQGVRVVLIIYAIIAAVQTLFAIILLIGAAKENPSYIKPWIIFQLVVMFLAFIMSIALISLYFKQGNSPQGIGQIFSILITEALALYFVIVVNSYRMQLLTRSA